jgi:hypothetical protein
MPKGAYRLEVRAQDAGDELQPGAQPISRSTRSFRVANLQNAVRFRLAHAPAKSNAFKLFLLELAPFRGLTPIE